MISLIAWGLLQFALFSLANCQLELRHISSVYVNIGKNETFIADFENCSIQKVDDKGILSVIFGAKNDDKCRTAGDEGLAALAAGHPLRICGDTHSGDLYFTDYYARTVRMISASTGVVSTIAGLAGMSDDPAEVFSDSRRGNTGLKATDFPIYYPTSCQVDNVGDVYVIEMSHLIVKISPSTGVLTQITEGLRTEDGKTVSPHPEDIYLDRAADTLYIASRTEGLLIIRNVSDPTCRTLITPPPIHLGFEPSITGDGKGHIYLLNSDSGKVFLFDGLKYSQLPDDVVSSPAHGLVILYDDLTLSLHDTNLSVVRKQFLARTSTKTKPETHG